MFGEVHVAEDTVSGGGHAGIEARSADGDGAAAKVDVHQGGALGGEVDRDRPGAGLDAPRLRVAPRRCLIGGQRHRMNRVAGARGGRVVRLGRCGCSVAGIDQLLHEGRHVHTYPSGRKALTQTDSADRLGDRGCADQHVAGELRPRRQRLADLDQRCCGPR